MVRRQDSKSVQHLLMARWSRDCARVALALLALALTLNLPARAATDVLDLSLEQLMEIPVVVGASKYPQRQSEVAASVRVITREDIRSFGWRTLGEALSSLPGTYGTYNGGYAYMGIRGLSPIGDINKRMLVTVNGDRINENLTDTASLGTEFVLDMDLIERIEYIPGPGSAVYGQNALFGVVNVVTRDGAGVNGAELSVDGQNPQRQIQGRASVGKRLDSGLDLLVSASGLHAGGENRFYDYGQGITGVATDMDGTRDKEFYARLSKGPWSFQLINADRWKQDPTSYDGGTPLQKADYVRDRFLISSVQYQGPLADTSLQLLAKVFVSEYRFDTSVFQPEGQILYSAASGRGAELRLLSTALPAHRLMVGLEVQDFPRRALIPSVPYPTSRSGVYAQDEWRISERMTSTLGLRIDRSSINGSHLSPRAALIWSPEPSTTLKLMAGRAFREPNVGELPLGFRYSSDERPGLLGTPVGNEFIDTLELGLDHTVAPDLSFRGALYHWTLRDQIVRNGDGLHVSGPRVKASGMEISADKKWGWGGRLQASLSGQWAHVVHDEALINSPRWLGKLHFSSPLPARRLRLGYELLLESARRGVGGARLPGHGLSNLHLTAEGVAPGLSVSLGIYNLFDKAYRLPVAGAWISELPQAGRSVGIKMDWKF